MKNNFNLRTFLTENKLTSNSKINENQLPDETKSLKASDAFRQVGIDMNEPVLVLTQDGGHGEQETKGTVSAREALKMFQQLRAKGMEDDKQDYYEFENELNFSAEGYEYKIAYFEEEATTTALMQKSGVSEEKVNEDIEAFSDTIQVVGYPKTVEDALKVIERYERDRDPVSREEAKEIVADMRATDDDDFDRNITNLIVKAFNIKLKGVSEKKVVEADRDEESMVHELIGDLFAPGNARSHLDFTVKEIARALKRYSDHLTRQGVKDAMDLYDKLAADGTLDKEVEEGNGFVESKHVPKLKKAFELIGLYGSGVSEQKVNEQLASQAVQEFIAADNNGVSIAEFVKAMIDGAAEFNQEEAAYQDLDKRSEVILKAIGRQDLIGGTNETAPGYMHDCAAKVMHEKYGNGDCIPKEHTLVKEGNKYVVTHYDVLFESGKTVKDIPVKELKIITESHHGHKRRKK